ncbi:MAG: HAMP domain-containing protein [Halomonadaceae bacterium]|nr:HAMP domain-containing protein [Halomonadaceae bacterium]
MKNISIKWSLTAAMALMVLMIGLISGLGFYSNSTSQAALYELAETDTKLANLANRMQVNVLRAQTFLDRYAAHSTQGNPELGLENRDMAATALEVAQERVTEFTEIRVAPDDSRAPYMAEILEAYNEFANEGLVPLLGAAPFQVQREQERLAEVGARLDAAMENFINHSEQRNSAAINRVTALGEQIGAIAIGLLVVALIAALVLRIGMMRAVVTPLRRAVEHFERIADGDLTAHIEDRGRNEMGQLYAALSRMQEKIKALVLSLRDSSESVFTGSGEIAGGSQDLSARTEEQAAALQQTASSMEEMASTVSRNTETAIEADGLAVSATQNAEAGGQEVARTVQLMREIAESAKRINEIVGVIDSIAFQTNILALNASVEAARAGEQGRGFAVVAGEVRSLASRSADSAREIRELIQEVTSQIDSGAEQAELSGKTIDTSVETIRQVSALMGEISTATREQNGGIEQINAALTEMDSVTQQNAALVEQTSAAAASLELQASQLATLIATFRVDEPSRVEETVTRPPASPGSPKAIEQVSAATDTASPVPSHRQGDPLPATTAKKPAKEMASADDWAEF